MTKSSTQLQKQTHSKNNKQLQQPFNAYKQNNKRMQTNPTQRKQEQKQVNHYRHQRTLATKTIKGLPTTVT